MSLKVDFTKEIKILRNGYSQTYFMTTPDIIGDIMLELLLYNP